MKELTIEYMTALLIHEMSKRKENKLEGDEDSKAKGKIHFGVQMSRRATIVTRRAHIARFCYKILKKEKREKECKQNTNEDDDYAFATQH